MLNWSLNVYPRYFCVSLTAGNKAKIKHTRKNPDIRYFVPVNLYWLRKTECLDIITHFRYEPDNSTELRFESNALVMCGIRTSLSVDRIAIKQFYYQNHSVTEAPQLLRISLILEWFFLCLDTLMLMTSVNKGNSSIPLFKNHKSIERKQNNTEENTSTIWEKQRNNKNIEVQQIQTPMQYT